ncbi:hypothetical protein A246_08688 [Pseudomonas syringae pv. actinidiae ICMP 19098]|nr:hypothetical protein A246_08688 [Pseudomonas syringae pv. actinidiae ICMP 19098]
MTAMGSVGEISAPNTRQYESGRARSVSDSRAQIAKPIHRVLSDLRADVQSQSFGGAVAFCPSEGFEK